MRRAALLALAAAALTGCPREVVEEDRLVLSGTLDRESIFDSVEGSVDVDYASGGARGEWWPCDLRLTALGCVGEHHVNVFLTLPEVTDFGLVGSGHCVTDGVPEGVLERLAALGGRGSYALGSDVNGYIVVASDTDDVVGAEFDEDAETTAATRLGTGTVEVLGFAGEAGITRTWSPCSSRRRPASHSEASLGHARARAGGRVQLHRLPRR
jgi:hypothetical protein